MSELEPLLTTEEVATFLHVEAVTVRRLVTRGELPAYRVAGEYRFLSRDLHEYLQQQRIEGGRTQPSDQLRGEAWQQFAGRYKPSNLAQQALDYASQEALRLQQPVIGPEHLLLGLLRVPDGVAARLLTEFGIQLEAAQQVVEAICGRGEGNPPDVLALTTSAKRIVSEAHAEAKQRKHPSMNTEHLLLALVRPRDRVVAQVLNTLGVSREQVLARAAPS